MTTIDQPVQVDPDKLMAFVFRAVEEVGSALNGALGSQRGLILAAEHPERVEAAVFVGPAYPGGGAPHAERLVHPWGERLDTDVGWATYNKYYWLRDYPGSLEFFMSRVYRAALDETDRGHRRLGPGDDGRDARPHP